MIDKIKVKELVTSYFSGTKSDDIEKITNNIVLEAEIAIYYLVREAVAQERKEKFRKSCDDYRIAQ